MYAVIKTGGKQHKVQAGDVIEVERLVHEGETVTFQPLLVVEDDGTTHAGAGAAKAVVSATPLGEKKGDKIRIFKYRPKSGYARRQGHRQVLTMLEITDVSLDGTGSSSKAAKTSAKKTTAKKTAEEETSAKRADTKETSAKRAGAKTPADAETETEADGEPADG